MLGVSIQKLQLLGAMPRHVIEGFPTINWLDSIQLMNH